jgi:hypothetical protein
LKQGVGSFELWQVVDSEEGRRFSHDPQLLRKIDITFFEHLHICRGLAVEESTKPINRANYGEKWYYINIYGRFKIGGHMSTSIQVFSDYI